MQANICMLVGTVLIYTAAQAAPSASASCWSKAVLVFVKPSCVRGVQRTEDVS